MLRIAIPFAVLLVVTHAVSASLFGGGTNLKVRSFFGSNKIATGSETAIQRPSYDRAAQEAAAITALSMGGRALSWFRLDDGVMGGRSETFHSAAQESGNLHFTGTIDTNGGGFCTIKTKLPKRILKGIEGIRIRYRGDGKTYKVVLYQGRSDSLGRKPTWQVDLPTKKLGKGKWQETTICLELMRPAYGGGPRAREAAELGPATPFNQKSVTGMGVMLSLQLADGTPNPAKTFGKNKFDFSLWIESIEPVKNV